MSDQVTNYDGRQSSHIHVWFELSYAHYLVLPRSLMQAMPVEWQARMVECLREMMEATRKLELNDKYEVLLSLIHILAVNPRGTTQLCSGCGGKVPKSISERRHKCLDCGLDIGRDHNAAINILRLGMSLAGLKDPSEYTNNLCINSRREYRA